MVYGHHHAPAALPPGKNRYQLYKRLGGPRGWSRRVRKIAPHRDLIPGTSARSESLYLLSCRGPYDTIVHIYIYIHALHHHKPLFICHILTAYSRSLPQKLTGFQLVKKFPAFYGTRKCITVLTSVRHMSLPYPEPARFSAYPHISLPEYPS